MQLSFFFSRRGSKVLHEKDITLKMFVQNLKRNMNVEVMDDFQKLLSLILQESRVFSSSDQ